MLTRESVQISLIGKQIIFTASLKAGKGFCVFPVSKLIIEASLEVDYIFSISCSNKLVARLDGLN